jgi:hypothetical protein
LVLGGLTFAALASPASAAGDRALDHEIVADPLGGGVAYTNPQLNSFVTMLEHIEQQVFGTKAKTLVNAAEAWHLNSSTNDYVYVTLIGFVGKGVNQYDTATQAASLATQAAGSFCSHASNTTPFANEPTPSVPNSHYVICSEASGTNAEAITTSRHGILELVTTQVQTIPASQFESIARDQYDHIKALAATPTKAKSSWTTRKKFGVGAAALAVVAALVVIFMIRRNRRLAKIVRHPPGPGWYPDPRHPKRQRYWTGADWGPERR